jgi:hypothetical protein
MRKEITFDKSWELIKFLEEDLENKLYTQKEGSVYFMAVEGALRKYRSEDENDYGTPICLPTVQKTYYIDVPDPEWYENIPKQGVLCWVSDEDSTARDRLVVITLYAAYHHPFRNSRGVGWLFATPATYESISHLLLENQK